MKKKLQPTQQFKYLAFGIRFEGEVTNSIGTNELDPRKLAEEFQKEFDYPLSYLDQIYVIDQTPQVVKTCNNSEWMI